MLASYVSYNLLMKMRKWGGVLKLMHKQKLDKTIRIAGKIKQNEMMQKNVRTKQIC